MLPSAQAQEGRDVREGGEAKPVEDESRGGERKVRNTELYERDLFHAV